MLASRLPAAALSRPLAPRIFRRHFAAVKQLASFSTWSSRSSTAGTTTGGVTSRDFDWDDVFRICCEGEDGPSSLRGYFERVRSCNRGAEFRSEFMPFVIEEQVAGYIHISFVDHLRRFSNVFIVTLDRNERYSDACISLHPSLRMPEDRTRAVGDVIKCLGNLIPAVPCEPII